MSYDDHLFAILVNPRDGALYYAVRSSGGNEVVCFDIKNRFPRLNPKLSEHACRGYFHHDHTMVDTAEALSGYPRVHTPIGVSNRLRGQGVGTVLYSSLALASHLNRSKTWLFDIDPGVRGDGVASSPESAIDRSSQASSWWDAAVSKFGLASRNEYCKKLSTPVPLNKLIAEQVASLAVGSIYGVPPKEVSVKDADTSSCRGNPMAYFRKCGDVDVLPFESVAKKNLVIGWLQKGAVYDRGVIAPHQTGIEDWVYNGSKKVNTIPLVNADFSSFNSSDNGHRKVFEWLLNLARRSGASERQLKSMLVRFRHGADIEFDRPISSTPVNVPVRLSRGGSGLICTAASCVAVVPTLSRWRPMARSSGAVHDESVIEYLSDVSDARKAMGWDVFSSNA